MNFDLVILCNITQHESMKRQNFDKVKLSYWPPLHCSKWKPTTLWKMLKFTMAPMDWADVTLIHALQR